MSNDDLTVDEARDRLANADFSDLLDEYDTVNGVGIGFGERGGTRTRVVELLFYVDGKLAEDELAQDQIIPDEVNGVPTDVIECDCPTPDIEGARGEQVRPISSGVSAGGGGYGTAVSMLDSSGNPVLLTNRHVACDEDEDCSGGTFYQPDTGPTATGTAEAVGTIADLGPRGSDADANLDGAIIDLDSGFDVVGELFAALDVGEFEDPALGALYLNCGSRTGYVAEECIAVDVTTTVSGYEYTGLARFARDEGDDWGGNSGSLHGRVDSDGVFHPAALHFAGSSTSGVAHPMSDVESEFGSLEPPTTAAQNTFSGPSNHECAIVRAYGSEGNVVVEVLVANTGGGDDPQDTLTLEADGTLGGEVDVDLGSMEHTIETATLGEEYADATLVAETSDDSHTLDIDVSLAADAPGSVNAVVDGVETEASNVEEAVTDSNGATASRVEVRADGDVLTVWPDDSGGTDPGDPEGDINLAPYVPDRAYNIYQNAPGDIREDLSGTVVSASSYDGRSGDLTQLLESASQNGEIVDLADGEYNMETSLDNTGSRVAIAGDGATVYAVGSRSGFSSDVMMPLGGGGDEEVYLQGFDMDISEGPDLAWFTTYGGVSDYIFLEDVGFLGQRQMASTTGGMRNSIVLDVGSGGDIFAHRCEAPDGGEEVSGEDDDYAIGFCHQNDHQGYAVLKDCYAANFEDNGFYMLANQSNGTGCLWNCHGHNNARGNIRPQDGYVVVGGKGEVRISRNEQVGTPFVAQEGDIEVYGLEMIAEGGSWGAEAIQIRTSSESVTMEKCVLHVISGDNRPIRMNGNSPYVTFSDMWIVDDGGHPNTAYVGYQGADATLDLSDDVRVSAANSGSEFSLEGGTLIAPDGTEYSSGSVSASELGLPSASEGDIPDFYFDYSNR